VLDKFDPDGNEKLDSNRLVMITYEYLKENFSQKHADLYRVGFALTQQTLGLAARLSSSDDEDAGKSIDDVLPEHIKNLKERLEGVLPPDRITMVLDLTTNEIEKKGLELDIGDLLAQVFNKIAFLEEDRTVTVRIGEEQKTYQTFSNMIGGLLNHTVEKFTKKCTSVDDLNNEEKFRETIESIANDFLSNNKDILNKHKNNFIEELNQRGQVDIKQPLTSIDELLLGAIGGMAEGFWLNRKQPNNPPN
jgi:hypothetical protein